MYLYSISVVFIYLQPSYLTLFICVGITLTNIKFKIYFVLKISNIQLKV